MKTLPRGAIGSMGRNCSTDQLADALRQRAFLREPPFEGFIQHFQIIVGIGADQLAGNEFGLG